MKIVVEIEIDDRMKAAVNAVHNLYDHYEGLVGGYGHIAFDDGNLDDGILEGCLRDADANRYADSYSDHEEIKRLSIIAIKAFLELDEEERIIAMYISRHRTS